jgi:hypothetical protein
MKGIIEMTTETFHIWRTSRPIEWKKILLNLLPLCLLSLAVMEEGFPHPPFPLWLAIAAIVCAVLSSILLLLNRWMSAELFIYSLVPFGFLFIFDEISTTDKTPFIALSASILTLGAIAGQLTRPALLRAAVFLAVAVLALAAATHAADQFWWMASDSGYGQCFPDYSGCPPLTGHEPSWLTLFFRF